MKYRVKELLFNQKHIDFQYAVAIALIGAMLVASMGALLMNTVSLHHQLQQNMESYADDLTAQLASEIASKMDMRNHHMSNLADTFSTMDIDELSAERMDRTARHMSMEDMFVVNESGATFAVNNSIDDYIDALRPYLGEDSELYQQSCVLFTEQDEVVYTAPIAWADGERGVLIGIRDKEALQGMLSNVAARCSGICCMVDSSGTVIVSATNTKPFLRLCDVFNKVSGSADEEAAQEVMDNVRNGKSGVAVFETIDKEPLMLGYDFLGINDWMLLTLMPADQFSVGVDQHLMKYAAVIFLMTVMLLAIFMYLIGIYRRSLKRIQDIALTDTLTGGHNIHAFQIESERLLRESMHQQYAVVYFNIRNFKRLNERYGVRNSDECLKQVYRILDGSVHEGEFAARAVGDHFFLLLKANSDNEVKSRIDNIAKWMVDDLSSHYLIDEARLAFGVYMVEDRTIDVLMMRSWARLASEYAKDHKMCSFYNEEIEAAMAWEHEVEDDFSRAIKQREFKLYVQPKIDQHHKIQSGEVLVRWAHPVHGTIPPGRFIPILERDGKICDLDFYMFEEACKLLKQWISEGKAVPLSVNLSRAHLVSQDLSFLNQFRQIKEAYDIPDNMIELELTESLMLERGEMSLGVEMIDRMREMGFLCSIDDFGFGHSSLTILKDLNVSTVKLDRQFFLGESEKSWNVVRQMIQLAHELDMNVVAEGIEDAKQVEKLWALGCNLIQGYVFAKPMPADEFRNWSIN